MLHISNTGPSSDPSRAHMFIVVTNECSDGKRLLVSICSQRDGCDLTCQLYKGVNSFIKWDSYVAYNRARIYDVAFLTEKLISGEIDYGGEFLPSLMPTVCSGVMASGFTPLKIKNYYQKVTLAKPEITETPSQSE